MPVFSVARTCLARAAPAVPTFAAAARCRPLGMPLVLDMSMPAFPLEPDPQEDAQHVSMGLRRGCS